MRLETRLLQSQEAGDEVVPGIQMSSTFKVDTKHIYSRESNNNRDELERLLGTLEDSLAVTYSSGLAAIYAVLTFVEPTKIYLQKGYHGTREAMTMYGRGRSIPIIDLAFDFSGIEADEHTLIWIESPLNPRGEVADFKKLSQSAGRGFICIDSTLAPPPIQFAMKWCHISMHSSTKYLGGHSDLLGGVLFTKDQRIHSQVQ